MDFIYNHAYNSGGRWHLVHGYISYETVPAKTEEYSSTRHERPEHVVASATVHCGVASYHYHNKGLSRKNPIKTGGLDGDGRKWHSAWRAWTKDKSKTLVYNYIIRKPMVRTNITSTDDVPEPLCGNCRAKVEAILGLR